MLKEARKETSEALPLDKATLSLPNMSERLKVEPIACGEGIPQVRCHHRKGPVLTSEGMGGWIGAVPDK